MFSTNMENSIIRLYIKYFQAFILKVILSRFLAFFP